VDRFGGARDGDEVEGEEEGETDDDPGYEVYEWAGQSRYRYQGHESTNIYLSSRPESSDFI
jgi:hypothetical protein